MTEDSPDSNVDSGGDKGNRKLALRAVATARPKLKEVQALLAAVSGELEGDRFWRYQRNVSPGLQEYIEALSFAHYLETGKLVSFEEVQKSISDENGVPVRVSLSSSVPSVR